MNKRTLHIFVKFWENKERLFTEIVFFWLKPHWIAFKINKFSHLSHRETNTISVQIHVDLNIDSSCSLFEIGIVTKPLQICYCFESAVMRNPVDWCKANQIEHLWLDIIYMNIVSNWQPWSIGGGALIDWGGGG